MKTKCKDCGAPVDVHSDLQIEVQCEACETVTCKCGSTEFKNQSGLYCEKVVCVKCDNLIEVDFHKHGTRISDEGLISLMAVK